MSRVGAAAWIVVLCLAVASCGTEAGLDVAQTDVPAPTGAPPALSDQSNSPDTPDTSDPNPISAAPDAPGTPELGTVTPSVTDPPDAPTTTEPPPTTVMDEPPDEPATTAPATTAPPPEEPSTTDPILTTVPDLGPTPGLELDFALPSRLGLAEIAAGFLPDPQRWQVELGGDVDVAYLGGSCVGVTQMEPHLNFLWLDPAPFLRFYVESDVDTVLIIYDPAFGWHCSDDVYGPHPAIDFYEPLTGAYDIWVGTFDGNPGTAVLHVTERPDGQP